MTNQQVLEIALQQQAYDSNCTPDDFLREQNLVVLSRAHEKARSYLKLPFFCDFVSYGNNIVASVSSEIQDFVSDYLAREMAANRTSYESFLTPRLHLLTEEFRRYGKMTCFMAEYFLPDVDLLKPLPCTYEIRLLTPPEFAHLYHGPWRNAVCEERKHLDVLAVAAYDEDQLIGLAGCSADCDTMWQIGIDVLPAYRRQHIACALTSRLAIEILSRGKVPFYCAAWSNLRSVRNAIKSGFRPAWVELTAIGCDEAARYMK